MSVFQTAAIHILDWLHHAERDLIGATVETTKRQSGIVKNVRLDDHHGLCFTFDDPSDACDWRPISTIRVKS